MYTAAGPQQNHLLTAAAASHRLHVDVQPTMELKFVNFPQSHGEYGHNRLASTPLAVHQLPTVDVKRFYRYSSERRDVIGALQLDTNTDCGVVAALDNAYGHRPQEHLPPAHA